MDTRQTAVTSVFAEPHESPDLFWLLSLFCFSLPHQWSDWEGSASSSGFRWSCIQHHLFIKGNIRGGGHRRQRSKGWNGCWEHWRHNNNVNILPQYLVSRWQSELFYRRRCHPPPHPLKKETTKKTKSFSCIKTVVMTATLFEAPLSSPLTLRLPIGHTASPPTPHTSLVRRGVARWDCTFWRFCEETWSRNK